MGCFFISSRSITLNHGSAQIVGDGDSRLLVIVYDDSLDIAYEQNVLLQLTK